MNEELKNEKKLKDMIFGVWPKKESFDELIKSVTDSEITRNRIVRDEIPSPYKLNNQFFVKKLAYIGVPVFILAAYLVFVNTNMNTGNDIIPNQDPVVVQNIQNDNTDVNVKVADSNSAAEEITKDASIDSLISGIISDADADVSLAINDTDDELFIQNELDTYNSINLNNYDEII